jgi:hypothetical protein
MSLKYKIDVTLHNAIYDLANNRELVKVIRKWFKNNSISERICVKINSENFK